MSRITLENRVDDILRKALPEGLRNSVGNWDSRTHIKLARIFMEEFAVDLTIENVMEMTSRDRIVEILEPLTRRQD